MLSAGAGFRSGGDYAGAAFFFVIPATAGIQRRDMSDAAASVFVAEPLRGELLTGWVPAFAGMTIGYQRHASRKAWSKPNCLAFSSV
jgi:hypothetical protein